jgi:hypothetical protein
LAHRQTRDLYCKRDLEIEREITWRLQPLSDAETALWQLDAVINARGIAVDRQLARAAADMVDAGLAEIDTRIAELTGVLSSVPASGIAS